MTETCPICYKKFEPATLTWARHKITEEGATGHDPDRPPGLSPWYGSRDIYWKPEDVEEYLVPLSDRCGVCEEQRIDALQRIDELCSDTEPEWFDSSNAGERWDDEY